MPISLESLASLATIAGVLITLLGFVESREWLVLVSLAFAAVAASLFSYARHVKNAVNSASLVIEGHSVDALNIANLRRRISRTFLVHEAEHTVQIINEDFEISWQYAGYCRVKAAAQMEFTINSEAGTRFDELDCIAYDLQHDSNMEHPIHPRLLGPDGISKKIAIPLLRNLQADDPFKVLLKFRLPRCARVGFSYYISSFSFGQSKIQRSVVRLSFFGVAPDWVRVYDCDANSTATLLKALAPLARKRDGEVEYVDMVENRPGQSAWVYAFSRSPS